MADYGTIKVNKVTYKNGSDADTDFNFKTDIVATSDLNLKAAKAGDTFTGDILIDNQKELRLGEPDGAGTNYVGFEAPDTIASNVIWKLPNADGSANYLLKTDGSGNLGWAADSATDSTKLPLAGGTLTGNLSFEGSTANDFETTITPTDPTADRTITLPDASGTVALGVIGTDIQAYDADTVKKDVANAFTASQRGKVHTISATSTLNIPLDSGQHFIITANGAGTLTFTDLDSDSVGQSGVIYFTNGAHTHSYAGHIKKASGVTIGATAGDYIIPYTVIATDKVCIDVIAVG